MPLDHLALAVTLAAPLLAGSAPATRTVPWLPRLGVGAGLAGATILLGSALADPDGGRVHVGETVVLHADRLGSVVAVFVLAMTALVLGWARTALALDPDGRRFQATAAVLAAASVGVALAGDLRVLAAAWVAVSVTTSRLIRHGGRPGALTAARRALATFAVGDLALVAATLVAVAAWDAAPALGDGAQATALEGAPAWAVTLVALGAVAAAVTRSALLPAHRWLAGTLHAPTPVSALLHAGVVNAGGLLLLRLSPTLRDSVTATGAAVVLGTATMVLGLAAARTRPDVKGRLVWSTSAQMGFMVVQAVLGLVGPALLHLLGHGMYKANLFLASGGAVDRAVRRRVHRPVRPAHRLAGGGLALAAVVTALVVLDPTGATTGPGLVLAAFLVAVLAVTATRVATARPRAVAGALLGSVALAAPLYLLAVTAIEDRLLDAPHTAAPGATAMALGAVLVTAAGWGLLGTAGGRRTGIGRAAWVRVVHLAHPPEHHPPVGTDRTRLAPEPAEAEPARGTEGGGSLARPTTGAAWRAA